MKQEEIIEGNKLINEKPYLELKSDMNEDDVNDFLDAFQKVIDKTRLKRFYIEGFNLNWRGSSGSLVCDETNAIKLINKVQPKTNDISIDVFIPKNGEDWKFKMIIYHHDCPTGSGMYFYSLKHQIIHKES